MAGLLASMREAIMLGPKAGRRQVERREFGDSLAELLEYSRGGRSYAGVPVSDESAMRLAAVWGCVDLLAEIVSTLPVDEFRRDASGVAVPVGSSLFLADPAGDGYGFEVWCRQLMESALLRGNVFGLVSGIGADTWPTQIEILHPDRVTVRRSTTFGPVEWLLENKPIGKWPQGPLWHVPFYAAPGSPVGRSPIRYAADTIGLGLAVQKFGSQWFGDGAHPTATLESDQSIDGAQAKEIGQRVTDALYDNRKLLVLGAGLKLNQVQVAPEESQFLETAKASADDIARFFFRRPPGEGGSVTYANVEARSLDLLTYTVNGWLVRLERALSRLRPRPRFVKFNADALVRVDLAARYRAHDSAIRAGWKSRNDVRRIEDLPPIPDGDEYLWPPYSTAPATPEETMPDVDGPPQSS